MARLRRRFYSAFLTAGMAIGGVNIVLGAPLLGLLAGSRLTGDGQISMLAVLAVAVVTLAAGALLVWLLALLGDLHDRVTGRPRVVSRHVPWLRSLSGERKHYTDDPLPAMSTLDYVLVTVVTLTVIAFEIWFFFYSGSPFDQRSGRD